jgi:protein tyrosine phosphatase (PTP) superfamily phosphohydrolase (DUF442 family)
MTQGPRLILLACCALAAVSCWRADAPTTPGPHPVPSEAATPGARIDAAGLHNVYRITDRLYSGSVPEGDEGFRSLQRLGIKTVISVDGMRPDVATAHKYGMRYVHIPFGYDGISYPQVLRLARAARDLPGPVYVHCHHGQHRGPAAAAAIHLCLDERCTVAQALAEMKRAGTDPHYTGLYAVPRTLTRPTARDLDRVPGEFPEVAPIPDLAAHMVEIDARWDDLKLIRAAGWKTPADHPDLDPPHEALQVAEHYREAARMAHVKQRPEDFRRRLSEAEGKVNFLEAVLRSGKIAGQADVPQAERAFQAAGAACAGCHSKYRDVPQAR